MKRAMTLAVLAALVGMHGWSAPMVDGKISEGEYDHSLSLIYDTAMVYYQFGADGSLSLAVTAPTQGWVGLGLGSVVMDGAHIFMGYVKDGQPVISEQIGQGHSHDPSPNTWADASRVTQIAGATILELHIPAGRVPIDGRKIGIIVAYSGAADVTTFHDDNHDGAFIEVPARP